MERDLEAALEHGLHAISLELPDGAVATLGRYLDLLLFWNRRINLTAVRDANEVVTRHFLDSLAVVPWIPDDTARLVDVGSGGGFPGAVIAIARPALAISLWEPNGKKAAFLRTLVRELPLPRTQVEVRRAEGPLPDDQRFDCAVSRATVALPEWLALGAGLVRTGGCVLGMEGAEQHPLPPGAERHIVPLAGLTRAIIRHRP